MRLRFVTAVVLALVVAPGAASAVTEKAALTQLKGAGKVRLEALRVALDGARSTLFAKADAFDGGIRIRGLSTLAADALADDLAAFQASAQEALFDAAVGFADDGRAALAAIDGAPLATLPIAFANLPGGVPERFRTSVGKVLARAYRAVNGRLVKSGKLVGADGASALFAVLAPPPQLAFAFTDVRGDAVLFDFALDLRMSAATSAGERRLWAGGTATVGGVQVVVSAVPMDGFVTSHDETVMTAGRGRFLARFGDGETLAATNYLLAAAPVVAGLPGVSASSSFAVR
ncbi:MAG: hypothetical protein IT293_02145 [Deltaproteobacteria bacterium]|nr:hypothetical protein [Deltaproteobacteria bacterium]